VAWEQRNVAAELPSEFSGLVASAQGVSTSLETAANLLKAAVNTAKLFVTSNVDPTSALANAIITEIETVVDDFFSTGFFVLTITPNDLARPSYDSFGLPTMTPAQAIAAAQASFDDAGDNIRPQFSSSASVTGFGIMATSASVEDLIDKLRGLISLLNLDGLALYLEQAERTFPPNQAPVASTPPDWSSTKLADIPGFSDLHRAIQGYLSQFRGYLTTGDNFLDDYIKTIEHKVNSIARAVDELNQAIDAIVGAVGATGVYYLNIPTNTGGNDYLKKSLSDSELESLTTNKYTAMTLFVAGGANTSGLENFRSVFE